MNVLVAVATTTTVAGASRGYLYVSNRLDEVLVSAWSLRAAEPLANVTLVADAASITELEARQASGLFDVVLSAETVLPGTSTGDSMGFRVQKLRALRATPYDETVYLDSDVVACGRFDGKALWEAVGTADVAGVAPRAGHVNGGVLAYRKGRVAQTFLADWERRYRKVMRVTRREQPVLQDALRNVSTFALLGVDWNCRGAATCEGNLCRLAHGHDAYLAVSAALPPFLGTEADLRALGAVYAQACPVFSGGHPLVVLARAAGSDGFEGALASRLAALRKDNDAELCRGPSPARCLATRRRYGVVMLADRPPPLVVDSPVPAAAPVALCWLSSPTTRPGLAGLLAACARRGLRPMDCSPVAKAAVRWFGGVDPRTALERARGDFAAVLMPHRLRDSFRLLERVLPSHFLRLADTTTTTTTTLGDGEDPAAAAKPALRMDAYGMAVLAPDRRLFEALEADFNQRLAACGV